MNCGRTTLSWHRLAAVGALPRGGGCWESTVSYPQGIRPPAATLLAVCEAAGSIAA